ATDNNNRTVANIKAYFNKAGGGIVPSGSLEFMFSRKAVFEIQKASTVDLESLELELIDAGLEEIDSSDEMIYLYADYTNFGSMSKALEDMGVEAHKAELKRIPNSPVEFTEEQLVDIEKMIDKIEDDDDVQAVYTNIA
ncbi:MAG: hypothetical protein RL226_2184, partial [Bacteroidota bacterium]